MDCYYEDITTKEDGTTDTRVVIKFPFALAPIKYAVLPLIEKNEDMVDLAKKLTQTLKTSGFPTECDMS